jgi:hypothetical protein
MDDFLEDFNKLSRKEQQAFLGLFAGSKTRFIQYQNRKSFVFMGKYECEQVNFDEFWLKKLPDLGWVTVEKEREFTAVGAVDQPQAFELLILPTAKGSAVREVYWESRRKAAELTEVDDIKHLQNNE